MKSSDKMKLVLAIVQDSVAELILEMLTNSRFRVTRISSTGGFLKRGQVTFLAGVEEDKVQDYIQIIREHSAPAINSGMKRAIIFVLKVDQFEQV